MLKLKNLKIDNDVLENICNNKDMLIKKIKEENNGNDCIEKEKLINYFLDFNQSLDYETINKVINIYINDKKENLNNIEYCLIINKICNDARKILENKKNLNNLDNNIYNALKNKSIIKNNILLPNIKIIDNNNKTNDNILTQEELYKIKKILSSYSKEKYINLITYKEFNNLLKKNEISEKKIEMIFEFKEMKKDQLIDLNECILIINKKIKRIIAKEITENLNKINYDTKKDRLYITNYINSLSNRQRNKYIFNNLLNDTNLFLSQDKKGSTSLKNNIKNIINDNNVNNLNVNEELIVNMINILKEKIFKEEKKQEKISEYFDILLSYNKNRKENILNLNDFENVLKYENFNFSSQDILKLFNYVDSSHKGYIDRLHFINAIKKIPFPITIIQKYLKSKKLSIFDIAYKMQFDIYNIPFESFSNFDLNYSLFFSRMKSLSREFDKVFLSNLFIALCGKINNKLPLKKMFEQFNVYNRSKFTYLNIYENKEKIMSICMKAFSNNISFKDLKEKILSNEKSTTGILKYNDLYKIINNVLKGKLEEQNFLHFLRINKLVDINDDIHIINFLRFVDSRYPDGSFIACVNQLAEFLDKECNRELFIFNIKLNNMNNNTSTNENINPEKLYFMFKEKNEFLKFETVTKFDYNEDGVISIDDIKNTILKYYDKHFFDNEKLISENKKRDEENKLRKKIMNFYIYLIELLKKNNLTENKFFLYLDKNKDELIDRDEFINQILLLPYFEKDKYDVKEIDTFFNYLDEFKRNNINIDIFQRKLHFLHDEYYKENKDNILNEKKSDFILEDLLLNEFCDWYKSIKNIYTEEEIFSMMDKDNNGIISVDDFKNFINELFFISPNELFDSKISNLIHVFSLNKENNNISLADIQQLIDAINKNDIKKYKENIFVNYIKSKNNNIWIKYIIKELKIQINQKYGNNIERMYNEFNIHFYQNKGQGLSFDNFELFISKNLGLFENYHLDKKELLMIFNYISNNKKFITLNDLKKHFSNNDEQLKEYNDSDFYEIMHKIIKKFLNDNFQLCQDAFQFFQNNNGNKDFITIKEFYIGINSLFPKKFETQTILNYFQKIFKKNISNENKTNELETINYSEFKDIYYKNTIEAINNLKKSCNLLESKILGKKMSYSLDKKMKINARTIIVDPIEKMKRIIRHSEKKTKKKLIDNYINDSSNGTINKYQFYNLLKKLNLGLSNREIEEIIMKEGFSCDGFVDLNKFNKFLFKDDYNLDINKKHIEEKLSEIKQLIIKYYTSPLLAFELNIKSKNNNYLDFEYFKRLIYEIYQKEKKDIPSYPLLKCIYDYIDYKKDGIISIDEWNHIFSNVKACLDLDNSESFNNNNKRSNKIINLKEWENSNEIIKIFKLISKNRKIIKDKFKLFSVASSCLLIHSNDLINILKEVLYDIYLTNEQWKTIINIGKKDKSDFIDFKTFITIIEYASKII